jgi:transposase-like protein
MQPGMTVSAVARLHGVAPSLLFQWRRRMTEGGQEAVRADEEVVLLSRVRELEGRVRELERLLGRKTRETEILRDALEAVRCALRCVLSLIRRSGGPPSAASTAKTRSKTSLFFQGRKANHRVIHNLAPRKPVGQRYTHRIFAKFILPACARGPSPLPRDK